MPVHQTDSNNISVIHSAPNIKSYVAERRRRERSGYASCFTMSIDIIADERRVGRNLGLRGVL